MKIPVTAAKCFDVFRRIAIRQSVLCAATLLLFLLTARSSVFAGSATWKANPSSSDWNTAPNWMRMSVPNGAGDTATFHASNHTNVSISADTAVSGIIFDTDASRFTLAAGPAVTLTISGPGITNNSGIEQVIEAVDSAQDSVPGGSVVFDNNTDAGEATLIAFGHGPSPGNTGTIQFLGSSRGDKANVVVNDPYYYGTVDISAHNAPGLKIGSLAGNGLVFVGPNNLTVGGNGLSTIFSGSVRENLQDGDLGGSFTKIGTGTLRLPGQISCSGGTTLRGGKLLLSNGKRGICGPVQVIRGTLGGIGAIFAYGDVIIGTGSSSGAKLSPGKSASRTGTLEVANGRLIFNSLSTYQWALNRDTATASQLYAAATSVTIKPNVSFIFLDYGTGTLAAGTVFTVIGGGGRTGTFSNLPDGATFTSNGTTFRASYTGGNGNDLTLTVQ